MKMCGCCSTSKKAEEFYKDKSKKDGLSSYCRPCRRSSSANRYSLKSSEIIQKQKERIATNPDKQRAYARDHWDRNRSKRNAEQRLKFEKSYASDILFRLNCIMRGMLVRTSKLANGSKSAGPLSSIGYAPDKLYERITCQLKDGMSWDNFGEWHIDHKKPIRRFIDQGMTDFSVINALSNLQPLWAKDNLVKGNKFIKQ